MRFDLEGCNDRFNSSDSKNAKALRS